MAFLTPTNTAVTGGSINIVNTSPIPVSGTFAATTDNTAVIAAIGSGNALLLIANQIGSGTSGLLGANLSSAVWISGSGVGVNAIITNTTPIPISGVVQANVTIGNVAITGNPGVTVTGFSTGSVVTIAPISKASVNVNTISGTFPWTSMSNSFTGQGLSANPNRVMLQIQNIHTGIPLFVSLSSNAVSNTNFSFILNPSQAQGYGGSSWSDDHWRGAVTLSGGAWAIYEL